MAHRKVDYRHREMAVFTPSFSTRVLLPLSLGTLCILGFLGWRQGRGLSRVQEARVLEQTQARFQALANDLRVLRAVWNGEGSMARSAARTLLDRHEAIVRIELQYRTRDDEPSRMLLRVEKPEPRDTLGWDGKMPTDASLQRRPALGQVLGIQPVRTMEEVLGREGERGSDDSGRAVLLYWLDESLLAPATIASTAAIWGPTLGAVLLLILGMYGLTRNHERRDRAERSDLRQDLHAARLEIQVLEESFEHRVEGATREIREVMQELERMTKIKDGFLSSVSHELRTPLTSIRSFAEILLQAWYDETPETRTEFLTIIREESKRICRLINQVLDLEKIESGGMDWQLQTFDLEVLAEKTIKAQGGLAKLKDVGYELVGPDRPVLWFGDEDRLQQVLVNLLSNAWKHSPEGGRIVVSIQEFEGGVEIRVEDEGPGVPDDGTRESIFEKFHQERVGEEGTLPSTGLGLPIAREIVHMHGGWISCTDGSLQGASFVMLLPRDGEGPDALFRVPAAERVPQVL